MAAEAFDVFGRGGPRQPNNIIKISREVPERTHHRCSLGYRTDSECMVG